MEKAKVYFTDMRCKVGESLLTKLDRLMLKAGISSIDFSSKFVAIKIHFGEPGNLAFLRPNFAKTVADRVKAQGGLPFLTDCNTLYTGRRKNALEHIDAAMENGYSPLSTGCQIIIADGLKGTDDVAVPIEGGDYFASALIGRAVMDADIVISLNHFKGHDGAGFGGAIKNLGMGCGSRGGKMQMHNEGKPHVNPERCRACGACMKACAQNAISYADNGKAFIDHKVCVGCGHCIGPCNFDAISNPNEGTSEALNCKMAEYAKAVVSGRPNFHINIVNQVSPYCDCYGDNDQAIVPDLGIFISLDPVAVDKACIDAVNAAPVIPGSLLSERDHTGHNHIGDLHPGTDWRAQIRHAEKIGLGTGEYDLITL